MKFTLSWLKEYLDTDASLEQISERLTAVGLEVEEITDRSEAYAPFLVAEILEAEKHPDADKLKVCKVNNGSQTLQIVCGAPNARAGIKVALAPVGSVIPTNDMKIKASEIRGVASNGMLCSSDELGLGSDAAGIMELGETAKVGDAFAQYAGLNDPIIEIAITPNRGDCLGVYGIARDLAASGLGKLKPITIPDVKLSGKSPISVSIEKTDGCSLFLGCYIKNIKNGASPEWLKQKLEAVGGKSISALVDVTNYLSFAFGRPAHVFDADKLSGNLNVRSAKNVEKYTGLDEIEYTLSEGMTVVADDKGVQALGGVLGGLESGCFDDTKNVFVEIALFDPINIATTGRKLQINSDARYRFERTVDPAFARDGMTLAINMIQELCGGEASEIVVAGSEEVEKRRVVLCLKRVEQVLGVKIESSKITEYLAALGFGVDAKADTLELIIPSWRSDVTIEEDIIEEIARLFGYDNIPLQPLERSKAKNTALNIAQRKRFDIPRILASRGLSEMTTFSFVSNDQAKLFANDQDVFELANPISVELDTLRPSILPHMVQAHAKNTARGLSKNAFFEVGPSFNGNQPGEQVRVAGGIRTGKAVTKTPLTDERNVDVFDVKADAIAVLDEYVSTANLQVKREAPNYYHPGRSGALCLGNQAIAYFGELHPKVSKAYGVKETLVAFEVILDKAPAPKQRKKYTRKKLDKSDFQAVNRDFAFTLDENVEVQNVVQAVKKADKNLIFDVTIFDIYQGEYVDAGKKSVAFSVTLQPKKETLTDEQINAVSDKIVQNVSNNTGGVLRDGS